MNTQKTKAVIALALFTTMAYGWGQQIVWNIGCGKRLRNASEDNVKLSEMNTYLAMKLVKAGVDFDDFEKIIIQEHHREMTED